MTAFLPGQSDVRRVPWRRSARLLLVARRARAAIGVAVRQGYAAGATIDGFDHPSRGGPHAARSISRSRRTPPLASDAPRLSPGPDATQQRPSLTAGPAQGGGDHRGHARRWRPPGRAEAPRRDRRAVARRASHERSARPGRDRPSPGARGGFDPSGQGWPAARGRDGRLGDRCCTVRGSPTPPRRDDELRDRAEERERRPCFVPDLLIVRAHAAAEHDPSVGRISAVTPEVDCERQAQSVAVVGVLSDHVHPAGARKRG